jgi:tetratricopeptide (TPR) repeat protein
MLFSQSSRMGENSEYVSYIGKDKKAISQLEAEGKIIEVNQRLQVNPQEAGGYVERGWLDVALIKFPKALADANKAILLKPKFGEAYLLRSEVYRKLGDLPKANADEKRGSIFYFYEKNKDRKP